MFLKHAFEPAVKIHNFVTNEADCFAYLTTIQGIVCRAQK